MYKVFPLLQVQGIVLATALDENLPAGVRASLLPVRPGRAWLRISSVTWPAQNKI